MLLVVARAAQSELAQAAAFYRDVSPELADRFVADVEKAYRVMLAFPKAGRDDSAGTKRCLLSRFPYKLIYRIKGSQLRIIAFPHVKQRPNYWKGR
jgi:toxin ParE1/3/4